MKRLFIIIFTVQYIPAIAFADTTLNENQLDRACLRHAVSLVARLKSEVLLDISQAESEQALRLATESCKAYMKKELVSKKTVSEPEKTGDENKDSFTDYILSGERANKKGNERLKRR